MISFSKFLASKFLVHKWGASQMNQKPAKYAQALLWKNLAAIKPLDNHQLVKIAHVLSSSLNICKWEIFRLLGTDHMMSISEKKP